MASTEPTQTAATPVPAPEAQSEPSAAQSTDAPPPAAAGQVENGPATSLSASQPAAEKQVEGNKPAQKMARRFSWNPFARSTASEPKPATPKPVETQTNEPKPKAQASPARPPIARTRSEKQAQHSAYLLRELIVGPSSHSSGKTKSKAMNSAEVEKVKVQLARPKTANKVIAQLRQLSSSDEPNVVGTRPNGETPTALPKGPIHAVCLACTDAEAEIRHFRNLTKDATPAPTQTATTTVHATHAETTTMEIASVANASITTLKAVFSEINVVSLITTPDLGLGGAPDGPGILSGALPTAETIIQGVEQITPQLMALGYATGKAILPDHAGVYPPTDRMSVITYWWGFELVLPPPSLKYLDNVPSITHAVMNFLTALSLVEGGVREIIPFVRYISQFVDTEFNMIKEQDQGQGAVCAATWIMPAALVPRPWDFPDPPPKSLNPSKAPAAPSTAAPAESPSAPSQNPPQTSAPIIVAPSVSPAANGSPPAQQNANVPKLEITPPTPPAPEAVKAAEEASTTSAAAPVLVAAA